MHHPSRYLQMVWILAPYLSQYLAGFPLKPPLFYHWYPAVFIDRHTSYQQSRLTIITTITSKYLYLLPTLLR